MNIYDLLREDHEKAIDLFDQLEKLEEKGGAKKQQNQDKIFSQLKHELAIHAAGEEDIFYSVLKEDDETRAQALEALEEHHVVKLLLDELDSMQKGEQWYAKLSVLRDNVTHHIEEEEGELFDAAQDILDDDEAQDMAQRMQDFKKEQMAAAR